MGVLARGVEWGVLVTIAVAYGCYLLGRWRQAAECPVGGQSQQAIVTKDDSIIVMLNHDAGVTSVTFSPDASRKIARLVLDEPPSRNDGNLVVDDESPS